MLSSETRPQCSVRRPLTTRPIERHVRATLGNVWSFPHTLLYTEPPRLAALGHVVETRETEGRRRRVFTITALGEAAVIAWLDRPSDAATELRDLGLLQLFFSDLASDEARLHIADRQLAIHRAKLAAYEDESRLERGASRSGPDSGPSSTGVGRRCGWACSTRPPRSNSGRGSRRESAARGRQPKEYLQ